MWGITPVEEAQDPIQLLLMLCHKGFGISEPCALSRYIPNLSPFQRSCSKFT